MSSIQLSASNFYSLNPEIIGQLIANRDWNGCWDYIAQILESLTISASPASVAFIVQMQKDMADEEKKKYVNELGALLGELMLYLLTDENVVLSDKSFNRLIFLHETIHTLFYIYKIDNTDAAVSVLYQSDKKKILPNTQKKILLLLGLGTDHDIVGILKSADEEYRLAALVSLFGYRKIFREKVYKNKIRLYELRDQLEKTHANDRFVLNLNADYFQCSYLNIPEKHSIKENINTAYRKFQKSHEALKIAANTPYDHPPFDLDVSRPTVLVIAEIFTRDDAMHRCWGNRTKSIQNDFNVVFSIAADKRDDRLKEEYQHYTVFENLGDLYQLITQLKPDIIFMPSLGMRYYNVMVSNMRGAPIQIMGLGHPATSMSDHIDYVVGPGHIYDEAAFPKDTYIADGYTGTYIPVLTKEQFLAPVIRQRNDNKIIEVAVVGSDVKVSYPFFRLLKEIVAESPYELHITFIMGIGIDALYIEKYLRENFKNCSYYGWQDYASYIETIKQTDIILNPFPFGHTNTLIDTLMCGKPCIGMDGVEPASKSEGDILRTVGLEEEFVAKDEEDYKKKFFKLAARIVDGETFFFDRERIYERLFEVSEVEDCDYGKVFKWIYENHEALKAAKIAGKRHFNAFDKITSSS